MSSHVFRPLSTVARRAYSVVPARTRNPVQLHSVSIPPSTTPSLSAQPPVVMLHGVLASEATNRSLLNRPDFVPHREKIAVDMRNHGRSPHVELRDQMTYDDMAADLLHMFQARGLEKVCLIGHSMGGKVAMHLALSHPQLVSELVVVDIAPVRYTPSNNPADPLNVTRAMLQVDLETANTRENVDQQLLKHGITSEPVRQFAMTNLAIDRGQQTAANYRWKANINAIEQSLPNIMSFPDQQGRQFDGPTCVIRGGKSNYVPFQSMRAFTALFPKTKLVTISEGGHWLQSQMPDQFSKAVNDFLQ